MVIVLMVSVMVVTTMAMVSMIAVMRCHFSCGLGPTESYNRTCARPAQPPRPRAILLDGARARSERVALVGAPVEQRPAPPGHRDLGVLLGPPRQELPALHYVQQDAPCFGVQAVGRVFEHGRHCEGTAGHIIHVLIPGELEHEWATGKAWYPHLHVLIHVVLAHVAL